MNTGGQVRYPLATKAARKLGPAYGGVWRPFSGEKEPMTRLAPPPGAAALREGPSVEFAVRRFYANDGTAGGVDIKLIQRRPARSESSSSRDGSYDHPAAPPHQEDVPNPFWTTVESERLGLSGRPTVVRILFERPDSPGGGDQHDRSGGAAVIDLTRSMETGSSASSGSEDEEEQPHTPRATDGLYVELTGHVTTIRVYLSVHALFAVKKDVQAKARGAKGVALCRLRLTHTPRRFGEASSPVGRDVAIGTVNTATIFNTPTSVPSMCGSTSTFFPLLDLPNNLLDAVLAHKTLSDMDIWGEHGITMTCRSLYDFVSREEFFICRYCSIWPWALGISRMPDGLPCHLLPPLQGSDDHDSNDTCGGEDSQDKEGDLAQTTSAAEDPEPPAAAEEEAPSSTAAPPRPQSPERSGSSQPPDPKTKLFVGGINWQCGEADLERVFGTVGEVTEAKVMRMRTEDGGPGKSRGFAFVHVRCLQSTFPAGLTTSPRASLASLDSPPSTTC